MPDKTQQTETKPEPTAAQQRRARRWKLVERSFSLAAIVVVLFLGWSAIQGMQRLFSQNSLGPTGIDQLESAQQTELTPDVRSAFISGGYWRMAGWQWDIGLTKIASAEVDAHLDELLASPLPTNLSARENKAIGQLIFALNNLPVDRVARGELIEYRIEKPDIKLRVVSRETSEDKVLVALGAAMLDPRTNSWTAFELRSQPQRPEQSASKHILPLPPSSLQICGRTDKQGLVLFEIVQSQVDLPAIVAQLSTQGWAVSPFRPLRDGQNVGQIPIDNALGTSFLCEKQNELVHIWSIPSNATGSYQLALMRITND